MAHYEFVGRAWQDANSNEGNQLPLVQVGIGDYRKIPYTD